MFLAYLGFIVGLSLVSMFSCEWWTEMDAVCGSSVMLFNVYLSQQYKSFTLHPLTWKFKILMFHLVMFPYYIWSIAWDWTKKELTLILGVALGPILQGCPSIFHTLLVFWSATDIILSSWAPEKGKGRVIWMEMENKIHLVNQFQMHKPVPKAWMSLNGVQLKQEFVGWIKKLGYEPKPFWTIPQLFADGSLEIAKALNSKGNKVIKKRAKRSRNCCLGLLFCGFLFVILSISRFRHGLIDKRAKGSESVDKGWTFDWSIIEEPMQKTSDSSCPDLIPEISEGLCFATSANDGLVLSNETSTETQGSEDFSFDANAIEFGTDNCATHHICWDKSLFVGDILPAPDIGVKGVSGSTQAGGQGTIEFIMTDEKGEDHKIRLENVIYLPEAAKNLISISQWDRDRKDGCGIMSRGTYSIFMWNQDSNCKLIPHCPQCPIPLMQAQKTQDVTVLLPLLIMKNPSMRIHFLM